MKIHEYQGKQLFSRFGVPVPRGILALTPQQARQAAQKLQSDTGQPVVVVKAQIHAGGRGKGGGVRVVREGPEAVERVAQEMLGMRLRTHQTGPDGQLVRRLYIEEGLSLASELYVGMVLHRGSGRVALMASSEGGVDIEETARNHPERIVTVRLDPALGLARHQAAQISFSVGRTLRSPLTKESIDQLTKTLMSLASLYQEMDCSLCEINPLVVTSAGDVVALDAKVNLDDNAAFRHPEWKEWVDRDEEDPVEAAAREVGLSYVSLDGEIGCLVNGAGLAMATMDIIKHHGGRPANFLDVGGSARQEAVERAFEIILSSPQVRGIFVNIFGGIMKCDVIARGIIEATRRLSLKVPLVVRLEGTHADQGRSLLEQSGLDIRAVSDMGEGARRIVEAVRGTAVAG